MNFSCLQSNISGCYLFDANSILVIVFVIFGTIIFTVNSAVLIVYFKEKTTTWTFTNYCFILLLVYNILAALSSFLVAISTCFGANKNHFFCLFKYCFLYFIGLMMVKLNAIIAIERLICVKWTTVYKKIIRLNYSLFLNIIITVLAVCFSYSPIFFDWNHFRADCDCALNNVIPSTYIILNNVIFLSMSVITSILYLYIYQFVKRSHLKVLNHVLGDKSRRSAKENMFIIGENFVSNSDISFIDNNQIISNNLLSRLKSSLTLCLLNLVKINSHKPAKLHILKVQSIIFFIFLSSWFPYITLTSYEILRDINTYETISVLFAQPAGLHLQTQIYAAVD
ncbi:hypothetical protein BpHYR1_008058 [Brachionus plicatilis]|uniref:G-protein coupled receptors family 1 profile domain-containing protein n=1 Tax=Brachionus plicatilis TaxID=10195 RepID=A0A3M7T311_BRAPC|nr:hypothetical protein BpHYR1_008058 [Brachionus plicatilis]